MKASEPKVELVDGGLTRLSDADRQSVLDFNWGPTTQYYLQATGSREKDGILKQSPGVSPLLGCETRRRLAVTVMGMLE